MIDAYKGDLTHESIDERELDYLSKQFDDDIQRAKNVIYNAQHKLETLAKAKAVLQYRIAGERTRRAEEQPEAPLRAIIGMDRMSIITDIVWNEFSEEGNGLSGYVEHYRGTEGRQAKMDLIESMARQWSIAHPLIYIDRHVNENMGHEDNTWCGISEHFTEECEDSPVGFKIVNMDLKIETTGELIDVWDSLKARLWTQDHPKTEVA